MNVAEIGAGLLK